MELSDEEKEIIRRYRQLSNAQKKAVIASEDSFSSWIEVAVRWLWEIISDEIITAIFKYLRKQYFES